MKKIVVGVAVPLASAGLLLGLGGAAIAAPIRGAAAGPPVPPPAPPALTIGDSYAVLQAGNGISAGRARTSSLPRTLPDYSGTIVITV